MQGLGASYPDETGGWADRNKHEFAKYNRKAIGANALLIGFHLEVTEWDYHRLIPQFPLRPWPPQKVLFQFSTKRLKNIAKSQLTPCYVCRSNVTIEMSLRIRREIIIIIT